MPSQLLSLFGPLPARKLEEFVLSLQALAGTHVQQFKTYTQVLKDEATPRPSDWLRLSASVPMDAEDASWTQKATFSIDMIDSPEMVKRPVTVRTVHHCPVYEGTADQFLAQLGFKHHYAYIEQGYRLTLTHRLTVSIYQVWKPLEHLNPVNATLVGDEQVWLVQCDFTTGKAGDVMELNRGVAGLVQFQREVAGYVSLQANSEQLR
ncbi:Med18 protein-domain-containing protein [Protomyces lactucae-debilis]|uniref:Mediator of RNA polymerase II transcription subunit 18 n=1 Tax=Protomyces lactucae-debilis TaxID=2754530 RepID=A0A1Y2FII5_PROLT|nr:Med18 protein-domain-containing protein [Protomyces lactucae-debilis]ORY83056.1 Med18 protein-domain-containing protein [Protomyces lactucae-debilis]